VSEKRFANPTVNRIAEFLESIGVGVHAGSVPEVTVVPGIHIVRGGLVVDETRLTYPGDMLHEAGHVVVRPKDERPGMTGDAGGGGEDEMAAMAWSYAAAIYLGIDPAVVFHSGGYRSASEILLGSLAGPPSGAIGVGMLRYFGMTLDEEAAQQAGARPFPSMLRWTR
jgi:hypothetical protein